jgi:tetratricopeptide (TPR) repeat protein
MNRYKICVYAICKNEELFVDRWMDAVSEADYVVVTDTGSDDNTAQRLRERGAVVYSESVIPWRFDTARNLALSHVPDDVDICVSNDLDEVFEPGWRQKLESAWQTETTRARYLFSWSYHSNGTPNKQFIMEKIHRKHGYRWNHPVHEVLEYTGEGEEKTIYIDELVLNHYPDTRKPRKQYLPLLELSAQENPLDDRTIFWLGREYMYSGMYDQCIDALKRHLSLPAARWDEERSASMCCIAKSYLAKNERKQARCWLYRAIAECPHIREPYYQAILLGYGEKDWPLVYFMTEQMLRISERSDSYLAAPEAWGFAAFDFGAISCYWLGLYQKAYDYGKKACELEPDEQRLKDNLAMIERML